MISRRKFFTLAAGVAVSTTAAASLDLRRRITGKTFECYGEFVPENDSIYENCTFNCYQSSGSIVQIGSGNTKNVMFRKCLFIFKGKHPISDAVHKAVGK